jgi:hypothetical protein
VRPEVVVNARDVDDLLSWTGRAPLRRDEPSTGTGSRSVLSSGQRVGDSSAHAASTHSVRTRAVSRSASGVAATRRRRRTAGQALGRRAPHERPGAAPAREHGHLEGRLGGVGAVGLVDEGAVDEGLEQEPALGVVAPPGERGERGQHGPDPVAVRAEVRLADRRDRVDGQPRSQQGGVLAPG